MRQDPIAPSTVPGWGIDADPENDPTYPMRDRTRDETAGLSWVRPPLQTPSVEVLLSVEHNRMPAVFGTSSPPSGLSGRIRRRAFRSSESQWAHWLLLMLADRINAAEGVADDLAHGKIPNLFAELGLGAEWRYNRAAFVRRVAVTAVTATVGLGLMRARRRARRLEVVEDVW